MAQPKGSGEVLRKIHKERPFFAELVAFMSRSPIVAIALEKENAVEAFREFIGATDPAKAAEGTIRAKYGESVGENAIHGSDSNKNAQREIGFFLLWGVRFIKFQWSVYNRLTTDY